MKPVIGLISNFYDFYDHKFANLSQIACSKADYVWVRNSESRLLSRKKMFEAVNGSSPNLTKLYAPVYGTVADFRALYPSDTKVVHHLDPYTYQGGDKYLETLDSLELKSDDFLVQYISGSESVSYRGLAIGMKTLYLKYQSNHDWKSNVGEVTICKVDDLDTAFLDRFAQDLSFYYLHSQPVFAFDFLIKDGAYIVLDLNIAPGIPSHIVDAQTIYNEVVSWYE